jgi:hypothetical protein
LPGRASTSKKILEWERTGNCAVVRGATDNSIGNAVWPTARLVKAKQRIIPNQQRDVNMRSETKMTGRLIAAARALTGISREDFAAAAGIPADKLALMEASGSAWLHSESDAEAVIRAFEKFGVVVIEEDGSMGAGVRLKFTRQDVKQINRLETEGGIVRSDDAP